MSSLRYAADAHIQEFNSEEEPDVLAPPVRRSDIRNPSLHNIQVRLERQFEAAQRTLAAQQKQTLKNLQEFCTEVIANAGSQQQAVTQRSPSNVDLVGSRGKRSVAWSEVASTLPGGKMSVPFSDHISTPIPGTLAIQSPMHDQRPNTPLGLAPEMPAPYEGGKLLPSRSSSTPTIRGLSIAMSETETIEMANIREYTELMTRHRKSMAVAHSTKKEVKRLSKIENEKRQGKTGAPKAVFADANAMKEKVKEAVCKPEYSVTMYYKTEGWAQYVARSSTFDVLTLMVIGLNALWIWIDTDYNSSPTLMDADLLFQVGENLFCFYFALELLVRFLAFKCKRDCMRDAWFVFDSCLVLMMVLETWLLNVAIWLFGIKTSGGMGNASILRLVRLLRLTRMARMARLLRAMPELMILVKGVSVAARSVVFTLLLLVIILYVFAIAFRQLTADGDLEDSHFKTVPESMILLLLAGVIPDQAALVTELGDASWAYGAFALIFILMSALTIMNMLVGVLVEVVSVVSSVEKEQMMVNFVKTKLLSLIQDSGIDKDDNKRISREEFESLLLLPEGARIIQEVGVDVVGLVDFVPHIFKAGTELSFADVMELVLSLRGTNTATVRDVVDLRKFLTQLASESHDYSMQRMSDMITDTVFRVVEHVLESKLNQQSWASGKAVAQSLANYLTLDDDSSVV